MHRELCQEKPQKWNSLFLRKKIQQPTTETHLRLNSDPVGIQSPVSGRHVGVRDGNLPLFTPVIRTLRSLVSLSRQTGRAPNVDFCCRFLILTQMKVIIPAAGVGTRLRPLTHTIPKALIYVAGKPILGHIIQSVPSGLGELVIIIGYMGDRVKEYVDQHCDSPRRYVQQEERLGLGHAVWLALRESDEEEVLILLGDTIIETDFSSVLSSRTTTIGVREVEDPRRFGVVEMESGYVKRIVEKPSHPKSNLIIAGAYYVKNAKLLYQCLEELMHSQITTRGEYQLTDALELMRERGERISVFNVDVWLDCGKPETLLATNRHLLRKSQTTQSPKDSVAVPPVYIAESAKITASIIGPYVSIGDRAVVSRSIIKDSIINENAQVKDVLLNKSIVGCNSVVKGSFTKMNVGDSSELLLR